MWFVFCSFDVFCSYSHSCLNITVKYSDIFVLSTKKENTSHTKIFVVKYIILVNIISQWMLKSFYFINKQGFMKQQQVAWEMSKERFLKVFSFFYIKNVFSFYFRKAVYFIISHCSSGDVRRNRRDRQVIMSCTTNHTKGVIYR